MSSETTTQEPLPEHIEHAWVLVAVDDVKASVARFRETCDAAVASEAQRGRLRAARALRRRADKSLAELAGTLAMFDVAATHHAKGRFSFGAIVKNCRELSEAAARAADDLCADFLCEDEEEKCQAK